MPHPHWSSLEPQHQPCIIADVSWPHLQGMQTKRVCVWLLRFGLSCFPQRVVVSLSLFGTCACLRGDATIASDYVDTVVILGGILYKAKLIVEKEVKKDISLLSCILSAF